MNKRLKVILNILIVAAAIAFFITFLNLMISIGYANREVEDPAETFAGVFEYELEHRAYGEIMGHYYSQRLKSLDPPAGYEDMYRVAQYAHTAFMTRVYDEKGDAEKSSLYEEKAAVLRFELGDYGYAADVVDEMLRR